MFDFLKKKVSPDAIDYDEPLPAATVSRDGLTTPITDEAVVRLLVEAFRVRQAKEHAEDRLRERNADIQRLYDPGCTLYLEGFGRITLAAKTASRIVDVDTLIAVLGRRFADLVEEKIDYKPTTKLLLLAEEDARVRQCIGFSESKTVSYLGPPR